MRNLFLSILLTSSVLAWAGDVSVSSPNNQLQVTVSDAGGRLHYTATLDGKQMLLPSALGLKTSIGDLTRDLVINNSELKTKNYDYKMRGTKASAANYQANCLLLDIQNKDGIKMSVIFQVSNNDIAFRYALPRQTIGRKEM